MTTPLTCPPPVERDLWRHRDFLRLWSAQAVSAFGSRITRTALPIIAVIALHEPESMIGVLAAMQLVPGIVLAMLAGGLVDRGRKRRILVVADLIRAALVASLTLAWGLGALTMLQLIIVGAGVGAATALFQITDVAYLPQLIGRRRLAEGNAKLETTEAIAEITGPASAGVLISALGAPKAVVIDALSYVWSAYMLGRIRGDAAADVDRSGRIPVVRAGGSSGEPGASRSGAGAGGAGGSGSETVASRSGTGSGGAGGSGREPRGSRSAGRTGGSRGEPDPWRSGISSAGESGAPRPGAGESAASSVSGLGRSGERDGARAGSSEPADGDVDPAASVVRTGRDFRIGVRAVFGHPLVRPIVLTLMVWSVTGGFFIALYTPFCLRALGLSEKTFGVIIATGGVGSLAGAFLARGLARALGVGRTLIVTAALSLAFTLCIPIAGMGAPHALTIAFLVLHQLLGDGLSVAFVILAVTLRQTVLPRDVLGRANAAIHVATTGMLVVAAVIAGGLATLIGIRAAMWAGTLAGLVAPAFLWPLRRLREMPSGDLSADRSSAGSS